ncbi:MAG TPA: histidine triad nucleotide-binding protein [Albitalea sp.]|uniref:histidine triad nucleotide-binding protein n=1 Tax=Piscinibacter sp. TaxID=1903157 RepID=UPI002ED11E82
MSHDPNCIFCKIATGQIPGRKAYEDDELLAFHDIHPWAPVHLLIIPKVHVAMLSDVQPEHQSWLGKMLLLAPRLMKEQGVSNGFRTVINTGADGGQEVYHLHMHVYGGPRPWLKG